MIDTLELDEFLNKMGERDTDVRVIILGFAQWFYPAYQYGNMTRLLDDLGYGSKITENAVDGLVAHGFLTSDLAPAMFNDFHITVDVDNLGEEAARQAKEVTMPLIFKLSNKAGLIVDTMLDEYCTEKGITI